MKCTDKTKSKQILLVLPLILLYIKIIWEAIWAMKMFYPYDLNMSWVIPVIIIDFIMAYFYGRAALNVRVMASVFILAAILAALSVIFNELRFYYEIGCGYNIPR